MRPIDIAIAILVTFLFGMNFVVAKVALDQMPALVVMVLRFLLVAVLLMPFVRLPRGRMKAIWWFSVTLGVIHFSLMFIALKHTDAAVAAIVIQIQVPASALMAAVVFGDRLGWRRALGMVVAIGGVVVLAGEPRRESALWAIGLIVLAAIVWAVSNIQMKQLSDVKGTALNAWMAAFAVPQLVLLSLVLERGQLDALLSAGWGAYASIVYQAVIVVVLCYGLWYRLLARYPVNLVMPWTLLVPVFGVAAGVAFRGEPLTWGLVLGGAMTVLGVAVIVIRRPRAVSTRQPTG